jgi:NAD kinase
MNGFKKLVLVTRKTRLEELVERFNTRAQAKFYLEHAGGDFTDYEREDDAYRRALELLRRTLEFEMPQQLLDRALVPTFRFQREDVVVTLGQDGLVANTAKYAGEQPIVGVNPEPSRFDGVLLPFLPEQARPAVAKVLEAKARVRHVTLAEARLNDGQRLLAFNDLFLGARSHVSALYRITRGKQSERQSSSGVLVATGAGSTGWISSVFNMASGVAQFCGGEAFRGIKMPWEDQRLLYVVREPFLSRHSEISMVAGTLAEGEELTVESMMPSGGAIFSDGMEADFLEFNSGFTATIRAAAQRAHLVAA